MGSRKEDGCEECGGKDGVHLVAVSLVRRRLIDRVKLAVFYTRGTYVGPDSIMFFSARTQLLLTGLQQYFG